MKRTLSIILIIAAFVGLTGCERSDLGNSYNEGTDHQFVYDDPFNTESVQAKGKDGYFFYYNMYLYYLDAKTQELVPLCNKANCLHDAETDHERIDECNAYVGTAGGTRHSSDVGISYYDGYLYFITHNIADGTWLQRIREDGSGREKVFDFDKCIVYGWCTHRGTLYYSEQTYGSGGETLSIKRLPLSGRKIPETVYEPNAEGITIYSLGQHMDAYGNYLYFGMIGVTTTNSEDISDESYLDYAFYKFYGYDIKNETLFELEAPDTEPNEYVSRVSFWKNRLVFITTTMGNAWTGENGLYTTDLDGGNAEWLMDVQAGLYVRCDEKYLYLNNCARQAHGEEDEQIFWVYDDNMELIDTFELDVPAFYTVPMSDKMGFFAYTKTDSVWRLRCYDKGRIGSLAGEVIPYDELSERPLLAPEE